MKIYFLLLFLLVPFWGYSQRHIKGETGFEFQAGITDGFETRKVDNAGYFVAVAPSWNLSNRFQLKANFHYTKKVLEYAQGNSLQVPETHLIPLQQYIFEPLIYYNVLSTRTKWLFVNAGIGPFGGYEVLNGGRLELPEGGKLKVAENWLYGPTGTVESEIYLSNTLILLASVKQRYLPSSPTQFRFHAGVGLKFMIQ